MKVEIVGVRFKKAGKIYYFSPNGCIYNSGDQIIVETARGLELGNIAIANREIEESEIIAPLKPVLRSADEEDIKHYEENKVMATEAGKVFQKKSIDHDLDMVIMGTEYTLDRNKLIFYFTAEGRIDFRELVKDLAAIFRTRIELRQIGVRDEAKNLGGLGCCGRPLCCSTWLGDFQSVSIKMAKDQNLSLNPTKISGICGRLFCCLKYEHEMYEEMISVMPAPGSRVKTADGDGKVLDVYVITEELKVQIDKNNDTVEIKRYKLKDITVLKYARRANDKIDRELEKELKVLLEV
ncbi:PSP1 domain-containing protein [Proteocatella sphenisci]|uniref:PSP1 domain-containing protein n=1 Tax=Proteocatella sphenisci TaxID=181070 RepID=UPI0004B3515D|nr:stage 0 sporulation family protein [Proteocatella sphenisci]